MLHAPIDRNVGRLSDILGRLPWRVAARLLVNGAVMLCLTLLGIEGLSDTIQDPGNVGQRSMGLALYGTPVGQPIQPAQPGGVSAVAFGLQELRQTHKILGIICRDERDRSVFVRDLTTGDERIYRAGDALNGAAVLEIHPSSVVLEKNGLRIVLSLFSQDPEAPSEDSAE